MDPASVHSLFRKSPEFFKLLIIASVAALPLSLRADLVSPSCDRTYTLDADFDQGTLLNLNHDPNHDQLQLNTTTTPFPFVNIACSGRGTAVRIDVNTGVVLGEYLTAPDLMGRDPSRTTVDKLGNVWVANRAEGGFSGGQNKGSITRIGLIIGGVRGNKNGDGSFTADPNGQYLQPPFAYSTVIDRDGDGLIKTSGGLGDILPWDNAGGVNSDGGVSTAEDELIINYTRVTGTGTRTVAVDSNNDVWTGGVGDLDHEKISGVTGLPIPGTQFNFGCGGYGGLIDGNGVLWSARINGLLRYDTTTPVPLGAGYDAKCLDYTHGDYGLGIDPVTGHIWQTYLFGNPGVVELDPAGNVLASYSHGNVNAQGVAVDSSGNVWVAHSLFGATTVGHLRTDGTFVGNVILQDINTAAIGNGPTGVAVDANGNVWVANIYTHNAMRINPTLGGIGGGGFTIGAVDLTVNLNEVLGLGLDASPYNYSDMTGFVAIGATAPSGTWTVVHDGDAAGTDWGTICWEESTPEGTAIKVEVRAADTQIGLASETFVEVQNCASVCDTGITGQFLEVRVSLSRDAAATESPILYALSVACCDQCGSNAAPTVTQVTAAPALLAQGGTTTLTINLADPEANQSTVMVDWDDGNTETIPLTSGQTTLSRSHVYAVAGVYTVRVTATDSCDQNSATIPFEFVIVYDPAAGFVTGGGFIDSQPGAYMADSSLGGRANFGFVSKYKKGASTPSGETEFQLHFASFNFHSTSYSWLVVAGARAQFKGQGTVNGAGTYSFLLTVYDAQIASSGGGVDKFRIKIWDNSNAVVYDNAASVSDDVNLSNLQAISGGSIVIHKAK